MLLVPLRCTHRLFLLVALTIFLTALVSVLPALAGEQVSPSLERTPSSSPGIDGFWSPMAQFAREGHTAIYDPVRDRIVVFGGYNGIINLDDVWTLSLSQAGTWTRLAPTGTPPPARWGHTAIYDPVRDRMLIFGGGDGNMTSFRNDVWALSLSGTPVWTKLTPAGTPPLARYGHTAIYDPVRDRVVIFGGSSPFGVLNDAWALSLSGAGATWTQLSPTGTPPSSRSDHTAIYDPVRDRMVVCGGYDGSSLDDTWALSFSGAPAWTQLAISGAPLSARSSATAIYDPVRDRMVVFGGLAFGSYSYFNDTWALSLSGTAAWTPLAPGGTLPSDRYDHTAIYDPVRDLMLVFAGHGDANPYPPNYRSDTWALFLSGTASWSQLTPKGGPPSPRLDSTAIYDPVRDRMVVFAGLDFGPVLLNDAWVLSLSGTPKWTLLSPNGAKPGGRYGHTAIYDPVRDRMLVFGASSNNVFALSLSGTPTWSQVVPTGTRPVNRYWHTAIYDPVGDRMVVFGGVEGVGGVYSDLNDTWALSLSGTPAWTQLTPTGTPPYPRSGHTAIYDPVRVRMVVHGADFGSYDNIDWALSLAGELAWTELVPGGPAPPIRQEHTAIYDPVRARMVIFGGQGYDLRDDTWGLTWSPPPLPVLFSSIGARADERGVLVRWNLEADEPISGFEVYRRVATGGEARSLSDGLLDPGLRTLRDDDIERGRTYEYFVVAVLPNGDRIQSQRVSVETAPLTLTLYQNHPNPFNPTTTISIVLPAKEQARLMIYDVQGRLVRALLDEETPAGFKEVVWDGRDERGAQAASGVYFYELRAGKNALTKKMVLLK